MKILMRTFWLQYGLGADELRISPRNGYFDHSLEHQVAPRMIST